MKKTNPPKPIRGGNKSRLSSMKPDKPVRGDSATATLLEIVLSMGLKEGFETVTVEALAKRSGSAKTTIYRRWPNVSAIIMDAFLSEVSREAPLLKKPTAQESFLESMKLLVRFYQGRHGTTMRTLVGRAQVDQSLRSALMTRWVEPRRKIAREIVLEGIEKGELRADVDPDLFIDLLYGPLYHRFLVPYTEDKVSESYLSALVQAVFFCFGNAQNT